MDTRERAQTEWEEQERRTILLVDDEAPILALLQEVIEDAGYSVVTAPDGRTALALARRQPLDLVITDLMMPHMDGEALLEQLQNDPRTSHLPVVGMSAATRPRQEGRFRAFLTKPFDIDDVIAVVARIIRPA